MTVQTQGILYLDFNEVDLAKRSAQAERSNIRGIMIYCRELVKSETAQVTDRVLLMTHLQCYRAQTGHGSTTNERPCSIPRMSS
jgi:hypothetical protein